MFASYPPLYPALFGLYTKVFGFGWRQVSLFDALLHLVLMLTIVVALRIHLPPGYGWLAASGGLFFLPLGIIGRPDELAMCFGTLATAIVSRTRSSRKLELLAGILYGLCAATSIGFAIIFGFCIATAGWLSSGSVWGGLKKLIFVAIVAFLTFACVVAPFLANRPDAIQQFMQSLQGRANEGTTDLSEGLRNLMRGWVTLVPICGLISSAVLLAWTTRRLFSRNCLGWWLGPLLALIFVILVPPGKETYIWAVGPLLIVGVGRFLAMPISNKSRMVSVLVVGLLGTGLLAGSARFVMSAVLLATLPRDQLLPYNVALIQSIVPKGSVVLAAEHWIGLGNHARVIDICWAHPKNAARVEYIVLTSNGRGEPGRMQGGALLNSLSLSNFTPVHNNLPKSSFTLLGVRVTRSAYGFGTMVWKRIS